MAFSIIQCLCLFSCALSLAYCKECNASSFALTTSFSNRVIWNLSLWSESLIESRSDCANICYRNEKCVSFFHNLQSGLCTAHGVQFYSTEPSVPDEGSRYYTMLVDKQDCAEILRNEPSSPDEEYIINPLDGKGPVRVYCDMSTDGGGWTVFQRRQDGSVDFYRNWAEYKSGFGIITGEFWLGNDVINRLTKARSAQLRVDLVDQDDIAGFATYSTFLVDDEDSKYRLTVSGFSGNCTDSLALQNGQMFSTPDEDNDNYPAYKCTMLNHGAWWYNRCYDSNLNGDYTRPTSRHGVIWELWRSTAMKKSEMKLRPT